MPVKNEIDEYKRRLGYGARPSLFQVELTFPTGLGLSPDLEEEVRIMCRTFTWPTPRAAANISVEYQGEYFKVPEGICYVSFTHSKRDTVQEISRSFPDRFATAIRDNLVFKDFSHLYYRDSITPSSWIAEEEEVRLSILKSEGGKRGLLEELINFLNAQAPNNLVIIDSLTNLVRACYDTIRWHDLISFLEGLQRVSKRWDGLIYGLLTSNIFEVSKETEIADCTDGVIIFEWSQEGVSQRQQMMYVKKFRGLMPRMEKDNIIRFDTTVTSTDGFVVTNVRRISGRR